MMRFSLIFCSFIFCTVSSFAESVVFDFESGDLANEGWRIVEGKNSKPIGNRDFEYNKPSTTYS
ncbi:MAG: hypothetical protein LBI18_00335, partial [Planctomycetaceae bacterium]|nr:hypothetical protein [Planctomycetaceae bacterium]